MTTIDDNKNSSDGHVLYVFNDLDGFLRLSPVFCCEFTVEDEQRPQTLPTYARVCGRGDPEG